MWTPWPSWPCTTADKLERSPLHHKLRRNPSPPPKAMMPAPPSLNRPVPAVPVAIGAPCPRCLWAPCGLRLQECSRQKKPEPPRPCAPKCGARRAVAHSSLVSRCPCIGGSCARAIRPRNTTRRHRLAAHPASQRPQCLGRAAPALARAQGQAVYLALAAAGHLRLHAPRRPPGASQRLRG